MQNLPLLKMDMKSKILRVIMELGSCGAARTLCRLVTASKKYRHAVVSPTSISHVSDEFRVAGVNVFPFHISRYVPFARALFCLARIIQHEDPLRCRFGLIVLRRSNMESSHYRWST